VGRILPKLLLGTQNPGKARELRELLREAPFRLVSLEEAGVAAEVEEAGATFEENARTKAQAYARLSGLWALADDSGLEVEALGGAPGPRSRRFAGEKASDGDRNRLLLQRLEGVPWEKRRARYRSVIAVASPEGAVWTVRGECQGLIALEPRGSGGFGYDPLFYLPELGRTVAELTLEEKNRISHRSAAARRALELLKGVARSQLVEPRAGTG
jgi:XTP/dITP diphosphohydrolase